MNHLVLFYCYDAYCGWCYGLSPVIQKIEARYHHIMHTEVLSGGMVLPEKPVHISATANYILNAYKKVEEYSGMEFGKDYLWHLENTELSDWFPNSEKPAIALCIFKEYYPDRQVEFAADLQIALHFEGRDLTDDESYKHLLEKYSIAPEAFFTKLNDAGYKDKAHHEFALCKQLQVTGYPCLLLQSSESKFYLVARGYTSYDAVSNRIDAILKELNQ